MRDHATYGVSPALQLALVGAVLSLLVAVTAPALTERLRNARTTEAATQLSLLYRGTLAYWYAGAGRIPDPERTFPESAPLTPAEPPRGAAAEYAEAQWSSATWRAVRFAPTGRHYFAYELESTGVGSASAFTARALGDLDGDGERSTFERAGRAGPAMEVQSPQGLWFDRPTE